MWPSFALARSRESALRPARPPVLQGDGEQERDDLHHVEHLLHRIRFPPPCPDSDAEQEKYGSLG